MIVLSLIASGSTVARDSSDLIENQIIARSCNGYLKWRDHCDRLLAREEGVFLLTRFDQLQAVHVARRFLLQALKAKDYDLFASDLWHALFALRPLMGCISSDEVLTHIFSRFCIGK